MKKSLDSRVRGIFLELLPLLAVFLVCAVLLGGCLGMGTRRTEVADAMPAAPRMEDTIYTWQYNPLMKNNRLVVIKSPTLTIDRKHPRVDGATALYPVYAAACGTIYTNVPERVFRSTWSSQRVHGLEKLVGVSTTPRAYEQLMRGKVDVIFCAQPSPAQIAEAKERGIEFRLTPIGREAFVFFVNEANLVDGLTTAQIRAIYKKEIVNWSEVDGRLEAAILPFQRPKNSGSQTAMEMQVMRGEPMAMPLKEEQIRGMGGIVVQTAAYRNAPNAIGYSFRFFVTTMTGVKNIKLLKIDGVAPTPGTIRDGTYPYSNNFYAITTNRTANNPHVQELIAWFLSEQGQALIEATGYVPLAKTP